LNGRTTVHRTSQRHQQNGRSKIGNRMGSVSIPALEVEGAITFAAGTIQRRQPRGQFVSNKKYAVRVCRHDVMQGFAGR